MLCRLPTIVAVIVLCAPLVEGLDLVARSSVVRGAMVAAARQLESSDFYVRYPYRTVDDVLPFLEAVAERNPSSVLAALELWGERYPMYQIGATKGAILDDVVSASKPTLAVEIGTFLGYSAVRIGRLVDLRGGALVCVEASPDFAAVARHVLDYATIRCAEIVVAKGSECAPLLPAQRVDLLFLDHAKEAYAPDLTTLENAGLVQAGSVVVADNVLFPGAPGYLDYVATPRYRTELKRAPYEAVGWETKWTVVDDAMAVSTKLAT